MFGKLLFDPFRVRILLVNLVDRDYHRNTGITSMMNRFDRLRFDAIISCNHQNDNVCHFRTTRSHRTECFMTRSVQKGNRAVLRINPVRAYMLGNAARFAGCNVGLPQVIKQRRLAVIDMTHDRNHWRSPRLGTRFLLYANQIILWVLGVYCNRSVPNLLYDQNPRVLVKNLIDRYHRSHIHQRFYDFPRFNGHCLG